MAARNYVDTASPTTLASGISNSATSLTLTDGTNYPVASFVLTLEKDGVGEEKVLVGTRTGESCTGLTRGFGGTTAVSHETGASVHHTYSAVDAQEANDHINNTGLDHHTQYHTAARHAAVVHTAAMLGTDSVGSDELQDGSVTAAHRTMVPYCKITRTTDQPIPHAANTDVEFQQAIEDTDSMWSAGLPKRITFNTPGVYLITSNMTFDTDSTGTVRALFATRRGSVVDEIAFDAGPPGGVTNTGLEVTTTERFATNDWIDFGVHQNSGDFLDLNVEGTRPFFASALWVGP